MVKRTTMGGVLGLAAVGATVVVLVANAVGGQAAAPSPSTVAQASVASAIPSATPTATPASTPSPTPTAAASPTAAPTATPIPTPILVPAPLTGRLVAPEIAARHPIAVMIDDLLAARPQSGLSSASVVWQAPAEGGIPRYMAIFQENLPATLGPVRSSRSYYIAWAAEWRAIYAHAGGSPGALATLRTKGKGQLVWNADAFHAGGTFHRIRTRRAPHNLYTTGAGLRALGKSLGAKDQTYTAAWQFAPDAPLASRPTGGTISVSYPYNHITYAYDRATDTYLRTVTGEKKETDAANGARIAPKNVVVMRMVFGALHDGHPGAPRLEAKVVGSGTAWISTNGRTITGTWKKTALTSPTEFFDKAGNEVTLTVGQTFVQVVTGGYPVSFKPGTEPAPSAAPSSN